MTALLIFGIMFSVMCVIVIANIFILYLGGKTDVSTYMLLYIALFFLLFATAACFAGHANKMEKDFLLNYKIESRQ